MAMARHTLLLALLLASGAIAAVSAQCVANPDHPYDSDEANSKNACKTCSADKLTCTECWEGYSLASDGTCVSCTEEEFQCGACDPEDPKFCYECNFFWDESPETGYYADAQGKCKECPTKNCMACENLSGTCTECYTNMGLMPDGTCKACKDKNCLRCDGDQAACQQCDTGFYVDKATGTCKPCGTDCDECSPDDPKKCIKCSNVSKASQYSTGVYNDNGQCKECTEGCNECTASPGTCTACLTGYTNMTDGTCAKCTDERCTSCKPGDPDFCEICATFNDQDELQWGADKKTGQCVDCRVENCDSCQGDADQCQWCKDGFSLDESTGKCAACADFVPHCTRCYIDATVTPQKVECNMCEDGWELNYDTYACEKAKSTSSKR